MKCCQFQFNGQTIKFNFNTDDESINIVLSEVFGEECYKKGLDWIKQKDNPVVVDLGAYMGDTALYFSQHKGVQIHALEPCQNNFDCLAYNVASIPGIKIYDLGIGSCIRQVKLDAGDTVGSGGESIYDTNNSFEEIRLIDLETFLDKACIPHVDLLKIDVEGAEYEIFASEAFFKVNSKIEAIIGETHLEPSLPWIVEQVLTDYGFKFEWLPYKNLNYQYTMKLGDYTKRIETQIPSLFFAYRN